MSVHDWKKSDIAKWVDSVLESKTLSNERKSEIRICFVNLTSGYELELMETVDKFEELGLNKIESIWFLAARNAIFAAGTL